MSDRRILVIANRTLSLPALADEVAPRRRSSELVISTYPPGRSNWLAL